MSEKMKKTKLYPYTVFIDILGYSNKVKDISNNEEANEIFDLLNKIELAIKEYFEIANISTSHKEYNMYYTFFSDCIILSFIPKNNINLDEDEIWNVPYKLDKIII